MTVLDDITSVSTMFRHLHFIHRNTGDIMRVPTVTAVLFRPF